MWRRTYLLLAVVRFYFALCPSYLHPDEQFQGPEVVAGRVFAYPVHETWEFTSENPVRSVFPLFPIYGLPMLILRWLWEGSGNGLVKPAIVFWTLRAIMFGLSFVLEDWAIHELVESPRQRQTAILLVASSYVTWSWQVHTFSNSIETIVLLWSLVLIKRIARDKEQRSPLSASFALAFLIVFGVFNRITFPAFLVIPAFQLIPTLQRRPRILIWLAFYGLVLTAIAIITDTIYYKGRNILLSDLFFNPVITPLNSLAYNIQPENLALHGTHPFYQHLIANLPQLLGPAFPLVFIAPQRTFELASAISAVVVLSCFSHQEARFLLPVVPLVLSSIRVPRKVLRPWLAVWIGFNAVLGLLMGVYHQGGIVPAQNWLEGQSDIAQAYWWKTYSPPTWLLDGRNANMTTTDLMGLPSKDLGDTICGPKTGSHLKVLVAPDSATYLDKWKSLDRSNKDIGLKKLWGTRPHLNLDDMDFGDDGVLQTLHRVVGRRGLTIWRVDCPRR